MNGVDPSSCGECSPKGAREDGGSHVLSGRHVGVPREEGERGQRLDQVWSDLLEDFSLRGSIVATPAGAYVRGGGNQCMAGF